MKTGDQLERVESRVTKRPKVTALSFIFFGKSADVHYFIWQKHFCWLWNSNGSLKSGLVALFLRRASSSGRPGFINQRLNTHVLRDGILEIRFLRKAHSWCGCQLSEIAINPPPTFLGGGRCWAQERFIFMECHQRGGFTLGEPTGAIMFKDTVGGAEDDEQSSPNKNYASMTSKTMEVECCVIVVFLISISGPLKIFSPPADSFSSLLPKSRQFLCEQRGCRLCKVEKWAAGLS